MKNKRLKKSLLKIYGLLYERFGPRHWWPGDTRLEIIIGAILTQNTAWANVEKAILNLKRQGLLKPKTLSEISEKKLARLIRPSGYYNVKAGRIKNFLRFLDEEYGGSIDRMFRAPLNRLRNELLAVKGIGRETADSILLYAGGKKAFVVDAYTKRIFSRHGFIKEGSDYGEIQALFLKNIPNSARLFNEYHALIVELGKNMCRVRKPLCAECPLRRMKNG
ncbi:MAG: endonuclease III domain-containing protein [Candidatus Omnitrophota bacterium]